MWPFTKKTKNLPTENVTVFKSTLCIPGNWKSKEEFILQLFSANEGDYIAAGFILMNVKLERHFEFNFCEHDEKMKSAFQFAGMVNRVSEEFINEIENHKYVVYITAVTGSLEEAEHISRAGLTILKAGGLGIKVETAGKAFEKKQWINLFENFNETNLYEMFVIDSIYSEIDDSTYSCGMHNLGYRDVIVSGQDFQESVKLIKIFNYYQIVDKPIIEPNQTFSCEIDSSKFRIISELKQPYEGNEMVGNPYGMWRLSKV